VRVWPEPVGGMGVRGTEVPRTTPGKVRDRTASGAVRPINRTRPAGMPRQQRLPDHAADPFPPIGVAHPHRWGGRRRNRRVIPGSRDPGLVDAP